MQLSQQRILNAYERQEMQKRVDETIRQVYLNKFKPKRSASHFPNMRKEWENLLEQGRTFTHLASEFPIPKKYAIYMTMTQQQERDRIRREEEREQQRSVLLAQGIVDVFRLEKELNLHEYKRE